MIFRQSVPITAQSIAATCSMPDGFGLPFAFVNLSFSLWLERNISMHFRSLSNFPRRRRADPLVTVQEFDR